MDGKLFHQLYCKEEYVDEGYVGKTKNLLRVEELIREIKVDLLGNSDDVGTSFKDITTQMSIHMKDVGNHKNWKIIEKILANEFGFIRVFLNVNGTLTGGGSGEVNAFTVTPVQSYLSRAILTKMPLQTTEHGGVYKDNQSMVVTIVVSSQLFFIINPEELTAIILHEVGHNFDIMNSSHCANWFGWAFMGIREGISIMGDINYMIQMPFYSLLTYVTSAINNSGIGRFLSTINNNLRIWAYPVEVFNSLTLAQQFFQRASRLSSTQLIASVMSNGIAGYSREFWSDSFATAYGYGPALITGLKKMRERITPLTNGNHGILTNIRYISLDILGLIPLMILDPHQQEQTRIKEIIMTIERASKDPSMPAAQRKLIARDLAIAKREYDLYVKGYDAEGRRSVIMAFFRYIIDVVFDGRLDIRSYLFRLNAIDPPKPDKKEVELANLMRTKTKGIVDPVLDKLRNFFKK